MSSNMLFRFTKQSKYMVSFVLAWVLLAQIMPDGIYSDNLIYAIGQIHAFDNSLFNNNVYFGSGGGVISPRFVTDILFSLIMKGNGGSWADAALLWTYFGMGVQAVAIANIAYRISEKYQIVCSAIFTCLALYLRNNLAGFRPIAIASVSMGTALAFAVLAISFITGSGKKYNVAWIFAGCAAICHIHEGIYCCIVIFIVAVVDCILKKRVLIKENIGVLVAIGAMALVTLPNMFTDKMDISNDMFVYIYSLVRHPHHLVPTSWGSDAIVKSGWINIFVFILSLEVFFCIKGEEVKRYFMEMALLEMVWFGVLAFAYIFTERIPLAFISTMFLSKMFKYVVIVSMILLLKAFIEARIHKLYLSGYLLLFFAFMTSVLDLEQIAILFLFSAAMIMVESSMDIVKSRITGQMIVLFDVVFFFFLLSVRIFPEGKKQTVAVMLIYMAVAIIYFTSIRCRKAAGVISLAVCGCLMVFSLYGRIYYSERSIKMVGGEKALVNSMGDEAYELAVEFREKTDKEEEFIADPDDTTLSGWFQVVSERNCYVIKKVIPSSKSTVDDWYERYMQTQDILEKAPSEVEQIMLDSNANYLLVKSDYFDKFDAVENMSVFLESSRSALRIYQLN